VSEIEKAARRRQPGTAQKETTNSTGKIYHIVKRAATTAGTRAPDRVLVPAAPCKEDASVGASPCGSSHAADLSATTCTREDIAKKQLAVFEAFTAGASGVEAEERRKLVAELTAPPDRARRVRESLRAIYRAAAAIREAGEGGLDAARAHAARALNAHSRLLAADGGGEVRT
jgi:hypothetical protein